MNRSLLTLVFCWPATAVCSFMSSNKSSTIHQGPLSAVVVGTALGGGDGSSLVDKLRELQTARDEELLTESEFQAARQNAIASLTNGSSDVAPFVSQQPTTGPAAVAEQSAPVVPIPMERGQGHGQVQGQAHFEGRISALSLNGIWCGPSLLFCPWCGTLHAVDEDTYVRKFQCCLPILFLCGREYRRTPGTNTFHWHEQGNYKEEDWETFNNRLCASMAGPTVGVRVCCF